MTDVVNWVNLNENDSECHSNLKELKSELCYILVRYVAFMCLAIKSQTR